MMWFAIATLAITAVVWVLFGRLRECHHMDWASARMCTRVHWRSCYEYVELADVAPDGQMFRERWRVVWSEHVYTNDDWLYQYDPC